MAYTLWLHYHRTSLPSLYTITKSQEIDLYLQLQLNLYIAIYTDIVPDMLNADASKTLITAQRLISTGSGSFAHHPAPHITGKLHALLHSQLLDTLTLVAAQPLDTQGGCLMPIAFAATSACLCLT